MKLFLVTALLLAVAASGVYSQACHLREVDLCMAIGMFHYQSNGVPPDEDAVNEWCETLKEMQECMGNFSSKCMSPLQRELSSLMSGSEDESKELCVAGSELRTRYLKHAECLAEGTELEGFKKLMKDLQVMIEKLFDVAYKKRFPLMCCGFRRFHQTMDEMTEKRCGAEAVDLTRNIIHMVTTELPETICQGFDPQSAQCLELLPPPGTPSKGADADQNQLTKLLSNLFGD